MASVQHTAPIKKDKTRIRRDPFFPALSLKLLAPICTVLIFFAVFHVAHESFGLPLFFGDGPFLSVFRDATGKPFPFSKLRAAPFFYGVGHILPAIAWSIFIPLQHSSDLRAKNKTLHRVSGYIVLASTTVLSITGLLFKYYNLAYLHPNTWHLHRPWESLPFLVVPNAQIAILMLSPWTLWTVYKTVISAVRRDIQTHKFWASMLTMAGMSIHFERYAMLLINSIGSLLEMLPLKFQRHVGVPIDPVDWVAGEMAGFSLSLWMGMALAGVWSWELWKVMRPAARVDEKMR